MPREIRKWFLPYFEKTSYGMFKENVHKYTTHSCTVLVDLHMLLLSCFRIKPAKRAFKFFKYFYAIYRHGVFYSEGEF